MDINKVVGHNLRQYRKQRNYSLDYVSKLTRISKTMLSQIEKGESNPSINTLGKLANGLHVTFTELITSEERSIDRVDLNALTPVETEDKQVTIYPYFPYDRERGFEMFSMIIKPGGKLVSEGHSDRSKEYIIVNEGQLIMSINKEKVTIDKAQAISFNADLPHEYINPTQDTLTLTATIQY